MSILDDHEIPDPKGRAVRVARIRGGWASTSYFKGSISCLGSIGWVPLDFNMVEGGPMVCKTIRLEMRDMKIFLDWDCLIHVDPNEALFELDHPVKARTSKDAPRRVGFYGIYILGIYGMKLAYQPCKWLGLEDDAFPLLKWSSFQGTC